ncbi:MAG: hypothetical protein CL842_08385 [Crocinitomicaceae bacterium]|nr:hypothetical protein [Crocinitomicaceae bacterium]|tara:strand:- start:115094 stop:115624 length:531 start_codon:yes stop_codon:yes gene_type:complete
MLNNMRRLLAIITIWISAISLNAQSIERSVIGSAGNEQKKTSIILSSTVGEAAVQTLTKTSLTITQGFQQSLASETDTSDGGGGEDTTSIVELNETIIMSLYPNPTHSSVNFMFKSDDKYTLEVFDGNGKLVQAEEYSSVENKEQSVALQNWENGVYHFRFLNSNQETTNFRVVKQ